MNTLPMYILKMALLTYPRRPLISVAMRQGQMDPYYNDIVDALKRDGYEGAISLESVYTPVGGTREDGFRESLPVFMELMGR